MHGCIDPYCVALCVQVFFARKFAELRRNTAAKTDVRIRYTNQMIRGSKIMKLLAWEESFLASIFVRSCSHLVPPTPIEVVGELYLLYYIC